MKYFIESIHGVLVDTCTSLKQARKLRDEKSGFRTVPRRIFKIVAGKKEYL